MKNMEEAQFKRKISIYAILFYITVAALSVVLTVCVNIYSVNFLQAIPCYLLLAIVGYAGHSFIRKVKNIIFVKSKY